MFVCTHDYVMHITTTILFTQDETWIRSERRIRVRGAFPHTPALLPGAFKYPLCLNEKPVSNLRDKGSTVDARVTDPLDLAIVQARERAKRIRTARMIVLVDVATKDIINYTNETIVIASSLADQSPVSTYTQNTRKRNICPALLINIPDTNLLGFVVDGLLGHRNEERLGFHRRADPVAHD